MAGALASGEVAKYLRHLEMLSPIRFFCIPESNIDHDAAIAIYQSAEHCPASPLQLFLTGLIAGRYGS